MPSNPPAAHEDLTIQETLHLMRDHAEHRPGEACFVDEAGKKRWLRETAVREFLVRHGADHPSNFLAENGVQWTQRLFSNL